MTRSTNSSDSRPIALLSDNYKSMPNEYETDEQFEEALAAGTDKEEAKTDFEGFIDFGGFSDENDEVM